MALETRHLSYQLTLVLQSKCISCSGGEGRNHFLSLSPDQDFS